MAPPFAGAHAQPASKRRDHRRGFQASLGRAPGRATQRHRTLGRLRLDGGELAFQRHARRAANRNAAVFPASDRALVDAKAPTKRGLAFANRFPRRPKRIRSNHADNYAIHIVVVNAYCILSLCKVRAMTAPHVALIIVFVISFVVFVGVRILLGWYPATARHGGDRPRVLPAPSLFSVTLCKTH